MLKVMWMVVWIVAFFPAFFFFSPKEGTGSAAA